MVVAAALLPLQSWVAHTKKIRRSAYSTQDAYGQIHATVYIQQAHMQYLQVPDTTATPDSATGGATAAAPPRSSGQNAAILRRHSGHLCRAPLGCVSSCTAPYLCSHCSLTRARASPVSTRC